MRLFFAPCTRAASSPRTTTRPQAGCNGVGASVVNALSKQLTATVKRDGKEFQMVFKRGIPQGKLKRKGGARGSGTTITFHPDPTIFPRTSSNADTIRDRLEIASYLHKGVKITFDDQPSGKKDTFQHKEGIAQYLDKIVKERNARPINDAVFSLDKDNGTRIETVFRWTESTDEHVRSYVNGIPTGSGARMRTACGPG